MASSSRPYSQASYSQSAAPSRPVSSFYGANNRDSYIKPGSYSVLSPSGETGAVGAGDYRQSAHYSALPGHELDELDHAHSPYNPPLQPLDLYGDFNNVAPKYSSRYSSADLYGKMERSPTGMSSNTLLDLDKTGSPTTPLSGKRLSMAGGELMNAPELGKDWDDEEARKTKVVNDKPLIRGPQLFQSVGKSFKSWFHWRKFVFIVFGFICVLIALCYFLAPRAPGFQLLADEPLTTDDSDPVFTRTPTVANWTAQLNVAIDGRSNWIPFHFSSFDLTVYDLDSGKKIGTGGLNGRTTFPGRQVTPTTLDIDFYYRGTNTSDVTWARLYNACAHKYNGVTRPNLSLSVRLNSKVRDNA